GTHTHTHTQQHSSPDHIHTNRYTHTHTHLVHHARPLKRVISLGRLSTQHDAVGSIQNGVGHVAALCTGGTGLLDHALQHLPNRVDNSNTYTRQGQAR